MISSSQNCEYVWEPCELTHLRENPPNHNYKTACRRYFLPCHFKFHKRQSPLSEKLDPAPPAGLKFLKSLNSESILPLPPDAHFPKEEALGWIGSVESEPDGWVCNVKSAVGSKFWVPPRGDLTQRAWHTPNIAEVSSKVLAARTPASVFPSQFLEVRHQVFSKSHGIFTEKVNNQ